ncbi:MAG TPA: integration host factor subunit beta [Firmicutes bacterium]|nr:integration host factor subunit beta [Bacillota bacterium]
MATVTKKDIVKEVARLTGYDTQSIKDVVQTMFDCMCEGLAKEGNIEIRNFGIFKVKSTPERQARNPKTSEIITVPAKKHIHFKPGQEMKLLINQQDSARSKASAPAEPLGSLGTPAASAESSGSRESGPEGF